MSSLGRFFGSLERFLASLLPYRVPIAIGLIAVLAALVWLVVRRGWHRAAGRWVLGHRLQSAALTVVVLAVTLPLGNYLLSPLWQRQALIEASPLEVAATASKPGSTAAAPAVSAPPNTAPAPAGAGTASSAAASSPAVSPPAASTAVATSTPALSPAVSPLAASTAVASSTPASATAAPRLIARGMFAGADDFHFGRGDALLIEVAPRKHTLRFENFSVRNGPDLFVYLSDNPKGYGGTVLKLGRLRATDGSFNYELPEGVDVSRFQSAIVWCDQFAVLFATAPLR